MTPETKMLVGKTALLWDHPFFGALIVQLHMVEKPDLVPPTMATDGRSLWYHPVFAAKLTKAEMVFVLAHEVLHNAFEHHIRRQSREPGLWNAACDYAINGELVAAGLTMPKVGLIDPRFTGLSAEEIYRILQDENPSGLKGRGLDPGCCGAVIDACSGHNAEEVARIRAEVQMQVRQAAAIAKASGVGKLPLGVQRLIDRLTKPVVDWRAVLRRFIDSTQTNDFSWARPNRRFLSSGAWFPGQSANTINHLVIAVDTSGSIDDKALVAFASEVNGAFGDGGIDKISVLYSDTEIHRVEEFVAGDELDMRPEGGGGTAFSEVFRWIAQNASDASATIFFTDLEVFDFGEEPAMPVMWAVYGDTRKFEELSARTPFGESISIMEGSAS